MAAGDWFPFALAAVAGWLLLVVLPCTVAWWLARKDRENGARPR